MFGISLIFALSGIGFSRAHIDCYYDGNDFCINQDDIMSVDLMPGSILLMDEKTNKANKLDEFNNLTIDGSMDSALGEMDFHRKRMNEYLCHGFMAEEIFREMRTIRVKRGPNPRDSHVNSLPDFLGDPSPQDSDIDDYNDIASSGDDDNVTVQHKLLADEGSTKYKDWLQRTTTLDDIYRHYPPTKKLRKKISPRHPLRGVPVMPAHEIEEFDGEVTGYAMPAPVSPDKTYYDAPDDHLLPSSTGHTYQYSGGHDHYPPSNHHHHHADLVPIIHEEHYYEQPSHHYDDEYWHRPSYHGKEKSHELSIKDFFEIALTALAFLAFGLFVIQLLMNITQNMNTTTAAPIVADPDGTRFRRNAQFARYVNYANEDLNELSHRVLRSIEAAMIAERDAGQCLRWSLCNDNHHSRNSSGPRKIWLPVWSLGMSWVSGRILSNRTWPTMLDSIKASVLGLGGADCSSLYPNCNLASERNKRRRRRRK